MIQGMDFEVGDRVQHTSFGITLFGTLIKWLYEDGYWLVYWDSIKGSNEVLLTCRPEQMKLIQNEKGDK